MKEDRELFQFKIILLLFIIPPLLSGCFLNRNISSSSSSISINIDDGSFYTSLSESPPLSGTSQELAGFEVRVIDSHQQAISNWQTAVAGQKITGLSLSKGETYYFQFRKKDTPYKILGASNGWVATTAISVSPLDDFANIFDLLTGEEITLNISGGEPNYTAKDGGSGFLNLNSLVYTVPLNINAQSDSIEIKDSVNQVYSKNLKIRAFEEKDLFTLDENAFAGEAFANGIAEDPNTGTLYSCGYARGHSGYLWITRKSIDDGATWTTIDEYQLYEKKEAMAKTINVNINGDIYVAGYGRDSSNIHHLIIRKSTDGGTTWNIIYDYIGGTGTGSSNEGITDIQFDGSGNVYLSLIEFTTGFYSWKILKSVDGGSNWTNLDTYNLVAGKSSSPNAMKIVDANTIYVVGDVINGSNLQQWLVRKTTDGGTTWNNMDVFNRFAGYMSVAHDINIDGNGYLYVVGHGYDSSNHMNWVVRKSTNGGSSWSTVDSFKSPAGQRDARAVAIAIDQNDFVYVGGTSTPNSPWQWTVKKSTDGGSTWSTIDTYYYTSNRGSGLADVMVTSDNSLWVSGYADYDFSDYFGAVRKSSDAGATWNNSDSYTYIRGNGAYFSDIINPTSNTLLSIGYSEASDSEHWIIRKSTDAGTTWNTVKDYQLLAGEYSWGTGLTTASNGDIYAAGTAADATNTHWITMKSTDVGDNWTVVDQFQASAGKGASSYKIGIKASDIYVVGSATDSLNKEYWTVRKSSDAGTTWNTVDNVLLQNQGDYATDILIADNGHIVVSGYSFDASYVYSWIVRKSDDDGAIWNTVDNYQLQATKSSSSRGILKAVDGSLYVYGNGTDNSNKSHLIIRKSTDGGDTWSTFWDYQVTANENTNISSMYIDSNNHIYISAYHTDINGTSQYFLLKSRDQGVSWRRVLESNDFNIFASMRSCLNNQICASGYRRAKYINTSGITQILSP